MPKKVLFESAVHQFLAAAHGLSGANQRAPQDFARWQRFIASLRFSYPKPGTVQVEWSAPDTGRSEFDLTTARFYSRTSASSGDVLHPPSSRNGDDSVQTTNAQFFRNVVTRIAGEAGLSLAQKGARTQDVGELGDRFAAEEAFHDNWAANENPEAIDVRLRNEACTAPEMRCIRRAVGTLRGKSVLDIGCGLGEASVYFALEGAEVTATDLSQKMLDATAALAKRYGVSVSVHKTAAERFELPSDRQFDVIHAGNVFHHVDIEPTLRSLVRHLKPEGMLVSWDPVAYNPLINVYRRIATEVRTKDEHPLRLADLRIFRRHFGEIRLEWFWLTTLTIFVLMATVGRRNPNKVRYWKAVVIESANWAWLYRPLERLDRIVLKMLPFLRPLCWNVVVIAKNPRLAMVR
jgi:SAM-dependent methyltransferase